MSDLLVLARLALVRIGFRTGCLLRIRPRVVLATSHAPVLAGNLAVVREELARQMPGVEVIELAYRARTGLPEKVSAAWHAIVAGFLLATSRLFVVDDYFFPIYAIQPRRGTTIIQTWHASGAFKKFGYSLAGKRFGAPAAVLRHVRIHSNYDVCLVSSERVIPHYAEAFRLPPERFTSRIGIPRTDVLLGSERRREAEAAVHARYALPPDRRVILYAPTYRGERATAARFAGQIDLEVMARLLGDEYVLLLRLHPFIRPRADTGPALSRFVFDASDYPDIHPLMLVSDVLITDYSSAIFEYSLLDRPMVFFAPDHEDYERERGFYFDYASDVPGPIFTQTTALAAYLRGRMFDLDRVRRFRSASFDVADGLATERFVTELARPALESRT